MTFVGPYKIMHIEVPGVPFEIPPATTVNGQWVRIPPSDFIYPKIRDAVAEAHKTVWTDEIVAAYISSMEGEKVASYNESTLTDEQFAQILEAVPDLESES